MKKIALGGKYGVGKYALVDDEDYERLSANKWCIRKDGYCQRTTKMFKGKRVTATIFLHREVMRTPPDMVTDHIDGNPLNNQKSNLRICTRSQNQWNKGMSKNNKSGYKGVKICGDKFTAQIVINRKVKHLGQFDSNKDAATAYNNAAQKYFGEYAKLNQIGV